MSAHYFRRYRALALTVALTLNLSACATRPVLFTSEPAGVNVTVDGISAKTPCTLDLSYGRHEVSFSIQGQPPITIEPVQGRLAAVAAGAGASVARALRVSGDVMMQVGRAGIEGYLQNPPSSGRNDGDAQMIFLLVTGGMYGVGYLSDKAGQTLDRAAQGVSHVHVVFPGFERATPSSH